MAPQPRGPDRLVGVRGHRTGDHVEKEQIQRLFIKQELMLIMIYGEPRFSDSDWLDLWQDLLWANWQQCRERGVTLRQWLRALRSLDPKYIGADWMITLPKRQIL